MHRPANGENSRPAEKLIEIKIGGSSSTIPRSEVNKVVWNATIQLKPDSEQGVPNELYGLHHNAHVSEPVKHLEVTSHGKPSYGSVDIYKESLRKVICENTRLREDDERIRLLKQIAIGVSHFHSYDRAHGNLSENFVFLSSDGRNHPIILDCPQSDESSDNPEGAKVKDIQDLGVLFYYVLTNGKKLETKSDNHAFVCSDKGVAEDLVEKMRTGTITIQEVLKHPLFWSEDEKLTFISDNYESIVKDREKLSKLEPLAKEQVFSGDWKEKLKLTVEEAKVCEKLFFGKQPVDRNAIFNEAGGTKMTTKKKLKLIVYIVDREDQRLIRFEDFSMNKWNKVMRKTREDNMNDSRPNIYQLLRKKHPDITDEDYGAFYPVVLVKIQCDSGYDKESFYDLLRFFRNKKAHYWEQNENFQTYFRAAGGYWKFFSSRFPQLLMFVYNNRNHFPHNKLTIQTVGSD